MPQTESAAFTAQFSADVPLRGDLQTNARQLRRAEAAGTLARAQTHTQVRLRLFVVCLYFASAAAATLLAGMHISARQQKHQMSL